MAKIKQSDLESMSNGDIRNFFYSYNVSVLPPKVKDYITEKKHNGDYIDLQVALNRTRNLLREIIIERFLSEG